MAGSYSSTPSSTPAGGVVPIYLVSHNGLERAAHAIGGEAMARWCAMQHQHAANAPVLWPDAQGKLACVVVCVEAPLSYTSCAALATSLPVGAYRFASEHIDTAFDEAIHAELALGWMMQQYRFTRYREQDEEDDRLPTLVIPETIRASVRMYTEATALVRDLINTPAADMGPEELADASLELARTYRARAQVIEGKRLQSEYPAIHTVGKGSPRAPRLIDLRWGEKGAPRVTLVGKGVCFDTGGLDIKPSSAMKLMKKDMGGAACVLGLAQLIMASALPVQLRVLIPAVENAVDGHSYRPTDIITMRSGLSVEVGDTDAEGRLVMADALSDACAESPDILIDCATLTGAARIALGTHLPALFSNDDEVAASLQEMSWRVHDPLWQMPLYAPYAEGLSSSVADTSSISSSRYGGAISAALFLQKFITPGTRWVHLDMMAWNLSSRPAHPVGGEAMGMRALFHWLHERYGAEEASA